MNKIAIGIEYDGTDFFGWQSQAGLRCVQSEVESAISKIANREIAVVVSGRTDRGVHALGQVAHFIADVHRDDRAWLLGINRELPKDIRVTWVKQVADSFHARFSAKSRHYRYLIYNSETRPSILRNQITWFCKSLDVTKMQEAGQYWLGKHDFSSFRDSDCQSHSPYRTLQNIQIEKKGHLITVDLQANAFLHHMVRNFVGTLLLIGEGKKQPIWAKEVLEARDRRCAGMTAPASGLYLAKIDY